MAKRILQSFEDAIIQPISENFENIAEFGFDLFIKNETLKDFPVLGSLFGFIKTGKNINDYFTVKKSILF